MEILSNIIKFVLSFVIIIWFGSNLIALVKELKKRKASKQSSSDSDKEIK